MKKSIFRKSISLMCSIILVMAMCVSISITEIDNVTLVANAANPYSNSYNIVDGVNYAVRWVWDSNPQYSHINSWAYPNCASFVSECLTAAGVKINQAKRTEIAGIHIYSNTEWSAANDQFAYLTKKMGYYYSLCPSLCLWTLLISLISTTRETTVWSPTKTI